MMADDKAQALMKLLKFSDKDLQTNRSGGLSDSQKRLIGIHARISLAVFVVAGLSFSALYILSAKHPFTDNVLIVAGLLGGPYAMFGLFLFWIQLRDFKGGGVKCAVGVIMIQPTKWGYRLRVDNVQLPVIMDLRELIDKDLAYRVYYLPSDKRIVSLERA
jgi:hypothetical protein